MDCAQTALCGERLVIGVIFVVIQLLLFQISMKAAITRAPV